MTQARVEKISDGMKIVLYLLSFFVPIAGFIIGFVYYSKEDPEFKHVGKMCVLLALIPLLIALVVGIAILMGVIALGWAIPWNEALVGLALL